MWEGWKQAEPGWCSEHLPFRGSRHCTLSTQLLLFCLSSQVLRWLHDLGQGYFLKINEGALTVPQAGHSSHLAFGPQPFKVFLFPSQAPWVSQQACSWLWFQEFFPCNPRCQLNGRSRTEKRGVWRRFLYLSLRFRQLKWLGTQNHYVWMQFWLCDSTSYQPQLNLLSSRRAVLKETGHFCSDCWQGCSQFCFLCWQHSITPVLFPFPTPDSSHGPHASPSLTNCRVSATPQCTHFAATVCTVYTPVPLACSW